MLISSPLRKRQQGRRKKDYGQENKSSKLGVTLFSNTFTALFALDFNFVLLKKVRVFKASRTKITQVTLVTPKIHIIQVYLFEEVANDCPVGCPNPGLHLPAGLHGGAGTRRILHRGAGAGAACLLRG
ncbi:hypothetical protein SDC9_202623 [bioreactor metagenome]|uniref:Uncharacterized protein n=1 Tax=bioreactor metagenome TaxID=1076179 RepID=A0A645J382_9ZZZZ